jgi:hypothetical protein
LQEIRAKAKAKVKATAKAKGKTMDFIKITQGTPRSWRENFYAERP